MTSERPGVRSHNGAGDEPPSSTDRSASLRIGLMVDDFPVISETFVINMAAGLVASGHEVEILAMSGRRPAPASMHHAVARWRLDERVVRPTGARLLIGRVAPDAAGEVPERWGPLRRAAAFTAQAGALARTRRFDVVHCQFAHLGLAAARHRTMRTLRADRLVVHVRGQDVTSYVRAHGEDVYRDLFARVDLVVANSRHFRDRAIELGAPAGRVEVIGSAVDCAVFDPVAVGRADAGGAGARTEVVSLVAVGRLVAKKGIATAVRAVALAADDGVDVRLDVVGDGPLRGELRSLVDRLGIAERVSLHGALPHHAIVELLATCDLLVAPSATPPSGDQDAPVNSLKEAMAMELPVIGTRHGGIPELVEPGVTGYLVDEEDPVALAATIGVAAAERDRWPEMGAAGRRRILEEYDLPVVTDRLVDAYRSLLETAAASRPPGTPTTPPR
ncbi:glycosyltransferase [Ilumatobacter sp.]|uniref:glycosyltransferase n=1 Tax=Ilumatobacter sp. TaxID=1967498 RepID=UPI003B5161E7